MALTDAVLELIKEGSPLSDAMTTKRVMMTPPLMELYAFFDTYHMDDDAKSTDQFKTLYPKATNIYQGTAGFSAITPAESADVTNTTDYMHWYNPFVTGPGISDDCAAESVAYRVSFTGTTEVLRKLITTAAEWDFPLLVRLVEAERIEGSRAKPTAKEGAAALLVSQPESRFTVVFESVELTSGKS